MSGHKVKLVVTFYARSDKYNDDNYKYKFRVDNFVQARKLVIKYRGRGAYIQKWQNDRMIENFPLVFFG